MECGHSVCKTCIKQAQQAWQHNITTQNDNKATAEAGVLKFKRMSTETVPPDVFLPKRPTGTLSKPTSPKKYLGEQIKGSGCGNLTSRNYKQSNTIEDDSSVVNPEESSTVYKKFTFKNSRTAQSSAMELVENLQGKSQGLMAE